MTQRSCFYLTYVFAYCFISGCFYFLCFKHLKLSGFISIICLGESYLLHYFHLSSLFSAFLKSSLSLFNTSVAWFSIMPLLSLSWLLFNFILPFHRFSKSPFFTQESPSHFTNVFQYDFLLLFYEKRHLHSTLNDPIF